MLLNISKSTLFTHVGTTHGSNTRFFGYGVASMFEWVPNRVRNIAMCWCLVFVHCFVYTKKRSVFGALFLYLVLNAQQIALFFVACFCALCCVHNNSLVFGALFLYLVLNALLCAMLWKDSVLGACAWCPVLNGVFC